MSSINCIIFKPDHLDLLEVRAHERENIDLDLFVTLSTLDPEKAQMQTMVADGKVLAIIGYIVMWPGVVEVFIIPSVYVPEYSLSFVRRIKQYLKAITKTLELHRIQSTAKADDATTKWMITLGFVPEGYLHKYTRDKKDYVMWARV